MTNQQGAPEALALARAVDHWARCDYGLRGDEMRKAAAELRRLHYENERLAALVEAQQPATHVQNPAEIEHVAGDVSKTGAESNMAQQPAPSVAADSVTAPEGPTNAQIDACARSMLYQPWGIGSRIEDAREFAKRVLSKFAPPAQAAPRVLEDAARLDWMDADEIGCVFHLGKNWYTRPGYGMPCRKHTSLRDAIDAAMAAARKQGGAT